MPKLRPKIARLHPTKEVSVMAWVEDAEPRVLLVRQALRESWTVFIASGVRHLTETNLECYFLPGIIVEIKTKGVKTLFPKSIGAAGLGIWIDGQGHCYCPRCSAKEIKIAKVDSRILSS